MQGSLRLTIFKAHTLLLLSNVVFKHCLATDDTKDSLPHLKKITIHELDLFSPNSALSCICCISQHPEKHYSRILGKDNGLLHLQSIFQSHIFFYMEQILK